MSSKKQDHCIIWQSWYVGSKGEDANELNDRSGRGVENLGIEKVAEKA